MIKVTAVAVAMFTLFSLEGCASSGSAGGERDSAVPISRAAGKVGPPKDDRAPGNTPIPFGVTGLIPKDPDPLPYLQYADRERSRKILDCREMILAEFIEYGEDEDYPVIPEEKYELSVRPLFTMERNLGRRRTKWHFFWWGHSFSSEEHHRTIGFPLFVHNNRQRGDDKEDWDTWVFPFFFFGNSADKGPYCMVFPIGGKTEGLFGLRELWIWGGILYVSSEDSDRTIYGDLPNNDPNAPGMTCRSVVWPFFTYGKSPDGHRRFLRIFPFIHDYKFNAEQRERYRERYGDYPMYGRDRVAFPWPLFWYQREYFNTARYPDQSTLSFNLLGVLQWRRWPWAGKTSAGLFFIHTYDDRRNPKLNSRAWALWPFFTYKKYLSDGSALLSRDDIGDYRAACEKIVSDGNAGMRTPAGLTWEVMKPEQRELALAIAGGKNPDKKEKSEIVYAVNTVIDRPDFHKNVRIENSAVDYDVQDIVERTPATRTKSEKECLQYYHRLLLEEDFGGIVGECARKKFYFWPLFGYDSRRNPEHYYILWPFGWYRKNRWENGVTQRLVNALPFYWHYKYKYPDGTRADHYKYRPFFGMYRNRDGDVWMESISFLPHTAVDHRQQGWGKMLSPFLTIFYYTNRADGSDSKFRLLMNMFQFDKAGDRTFNQVTPLFSWGDLGEKAYRWDVLYGLTGWTQTAEQNTLRLFWLPISWNRDQTNRSESIE